MILNLSITLSNTLGSIDANSLADNIEGIIENYTGFNAKTTIYDSDGVNSSNPILTYNRFKKIKRE